MQSSQPLVSVVIPCYNHESFVQDSIKSVIDQTYDNIELIIIDDGSKDNSVIKIQEMIELCEKRFKRFEFRSRANIGLSATLNEALEWCEGKYFSANASDDMILKNKIAIQVDMLEKDNEIIAIFGGVNSIDGSNKKINRFLPKKIIYNFEDIIMHRHNLLTPTYMTRLEAIKRVRGYKTDLIIEDWYMWLKLSEIGNILYIDEIFALYRQHDNNMSKNLKKMQQGRLEVLESFRSHPLYEEALININWYNEVELLSTEKNLRSLISFFNKNPRKTIELIIKSLKYKWDVFFG